jgi:hypothetical protein
MNTVVICTSELSLAARSQHELYQDGGCTISEMGTNAY